MWSRWIAPFVLAVSLAGCTLMLEFPGDGAASCRPDGTCAAGLKCENKVCVPSTTESNQVLGVTVMGAGSGRVRSTPQGLDCDTGRCTARYPRQTEVQLSAVPTNGASFSGWSGGGCEGKGPQDCRIALTSDLEVTATFHQAARTDVSLTVALAGNGSGTITSDPAGIACGGGGSCSASYAANTRVTLTATPSGNSAFTGWAGACSGTGSTCTVPLAAAASATATFELITYPVTVVIDEPGRGSVSTSAGNTCASGTCSYAYPKGSRIDLTATAAVGSLLLGWSGDCSGNQPSCSVAIIGPRRVTARFGPTPPNTHALTVRVSGSGSVTSAPAGINCPSGSCTTAFDQGTQVTLTASPNPHHEFVAWSGACAGASTSCTVTMTQALNITAEFRPVLFNLTVVLDGPGSGTVTGTGGLSFSSGTCTASYPSGTPVQLSATATGTGSTFQAWSGDCAGGAACSFEMNGHRQVRATFGANHVLTVSLAGSGGGAVTSDLGGINCPSNCSASFPHGTTVTLTAAEGTDSTFIGWAGRCDSISGSTCTVQLTSASSVTATFQRSTRVLAVTISAATGSSGRVTSAPQGIDCTAGSCNASFPLNSQVTLTATPAPGTAFVGWSGGGCSGRGSCSVTMDDLKQVTAHFEVNRLTVSTSGSGTVYSSPAGIACPSQCTADFNHAAQVTLTAAPASEHQFSGWSGGGCTGTSYCTVTMEGAKSVSANFQRLYLLTLRVQGGSSGVNISGASYCQSGETCTRQFPANSSVSFYAYDSSRFQRWEGDLNCDTRPYCTITMSSAKNITAVYSSSLRDPPAENCIQPGCAKSDSVLSISLAGDGTGSVSSSPPGIDCPGTCSASFPTGTSVSLTATSGMGSYFPRWDGGCRGSSRFCTVEMAGDLTTTARFDRQSHNLVFVSSKSYPANLGSASAYDRECNTLATAAGINNASGDAFVALMQTGSRSLHYLAGGARGFIGVDGRPFAEVLPSEAILNPLRLDENGDDTGGASVWTGAAGQSCADWTSASPERTAATGSTFGGPTRWLHSAEGDCTQSRRIYCAMTTRTEPLPASPVAGKRIFLSRGEPRSASNSTSADARCDLERPAGARAARAIILGSGGSARELLDPAMVYVRPDGQRLGTGDEIGAGRFQTGIWQSGDGAYLPGELPATGHRSPACIEQ